MIVKKRGEKPEPFLFIAIRLNQALRILGGYKVIIGCFECNLVRLSSLTAHSPSQRCFLPLAVSRVCLCDIRGIWLSSFSLLPRVLAFDFPTPSTPLSFSLV